MFEFDQVKDTRRGEASDDVFVSALAGMPVEGEQTSRSSREALVE